MTFKEYKKLNLSQISDEILSYWEDNDIFKKLQEPKNPPRTYLRFSYELLGKTQQEPAQNGFLLWLTARTQLSEA